ncbi:MAG TPA: hypothetical protein VLS46_00205 [Gaiellaceae bacterium]|nr:hypothetical protein [Gaiellaceae bacterium]
MGFARRGNVVWLSMVLSGLALAAFVMISWPESSVRLVRLPYGESMPKSSLAAPERQQPVQPVRTVAAVAPASQPEVAAEPELAAAEPGSLTQGPAPVGSDLEDDGYFESPESLGAEPLPGFGGTPARDDQPVAEAAPAPPAPADGEDELEDEPVLDVVIGLPQPPPHDEP